MARIEKDGKTVYVPVGFTMEVPAGDTPGIKAEYDSWDGYVFSEMLVGVEELLRQILDHALADNPEMKERVERERLLDGEPFEAAEIASKRVLLKLRGINPDTSAADNA